MSLFNPWVILGIVVLCAASALGGAKIESDHRDAQLLTQERVLHEAFVTRAALLRNNANAVSQKFNLTRAGHAKQLQVYERQLTEAKNANQLGKCETVVVAADGKPAVTVQSINAGLWDSALSEGGQRPGGDPGRANGTPGGTDFAPLEAAYRNLGQNGDRWKKCRAQVRGWQELAVKNGWVTQ